MKAKSISDPFLLQENFEDFFENSLCGHVIADGQGKILRINKRLASWLGCDASTFEGRGFSDMLTIGGKIYYETHLWPLLRMQGYFEEVALELGCANKEKLQVLINAYERRDDNGQPLFIRSVIFKATDRRIYEQNLREAKAVAEINLKNEMQLSSLREQFIAVMGHDLRNPLGAIIAGTSLLEMGDLDPDNKKIVEVIARSAQRMNELIHNVMDFARARLGGGMVLTIQRVFLAPVLTQVVDELTTMWPNRQIAIEFDLPEPVSCDPDRVAQLFSNLLANAITHGAQDKPVSVKAFYKEGVFELSVSNSGEPIPEEHLEKLFEPFTRETTRPSQQGLGLGLYIASEISRAHGGTLTAKSTIEETRFSFRIEG
jgi:phosphoserine phosphatase RsbU/P